MGEANTEVKMITIALEDEKEEQKSSDERVSEVKRRQHLEKISHLRVDFPTWK